MKSHTKIAEEIANDSESNNKIIVRIWLPPNRELSQNHEGHISIEYRSGKDRHYLSLWPKHHPKNPFKEEPDFYGWTDRLVLKDDLILSYGKDKNLEGRDADHHFKFKNLAIDKIFLDYFIPLFSSYKCNAGFNCLTMNPPSVTPTTKEEIYPQQYKEYLVCEFYEWDDEKEQHIITDHSCVTQTWNILIRGGILDLLDHPNHSLASIFSSKKTKAPNDLEELIDLLKKASYNQECMRKANLKWTVPRDNFKNAIQSLEKQGGDKVVCESLSHLYSVLANEVGLSAHQSNYIAVFNHFTNLTNQWAKKPLTCEEIEASHKELKKKLLGFGSVALKSAICGVIGAMIGFAIGVTIGAMITCWSGGLGALPGALLGALTGFSLGTSIGLGSGSAIGCAVGFFQAKKQQAAAKPLYEKATETFIELCNRSKAEQQELISPKTTHTKILR